MKEYKEQHVKAYITLENLPKEGFPIEADIGIQISEDGRIWVCINGSAFLRATPHVNRKMFKNA